MSSYTRIHRLCDGKMEVMMMRKCKFNFNAEVTVCEGSHVRTCMSVAFNCGETRGNTVECGCIRRDVLKKFEAGL